VPELLELDNRVDQTAIDLGDPDAQERRGRRWLIWSFIFCPCHLPWSMALLASIFGGSALGTMISHNAIGVGIAFGVVYAIGVGIGFKHIRRAVRGRDCSKGQCKI